ncbi:cysteine synthase A [Dongia mobilis]|uniref:cysteine synthase n=1 Tax=Dongia mobilis TaxID=578943 RepID=A0A4R6WZ90_9PROT|nr:cysteine synthase A [Dongia mobilis]TDQ86367.1 cysteine synthase A [Dongia mobilis]
MSSASATFRGKIYDNFLATIGATPVVRLAKLAKAEGVSADLLGKLEFFNPLSSVKDRIGLAMIEALEQSGKLQPGGTLIEPTSGNTGIALAFVAAAKGYRLILTMPESMSLERRKMLRLLGAELELTPAARGMSGAIQRAEELAAATPGAVIPQQFKNLANPEIHRRTTVQEILEDCDGRLDYFVSGVGTGGTITGVGEVLKKEIPGVKIVAVEPEDSPVLSGGQPGPHKIQGIGAGFVPEILNKGIIDEVLRISNANAFAMARKAAKLEGMPVGISSGAALTAGIELGQRPEAAGKRILVVLPSSAERYLSTALFEGLE